MGNIFFYFYLTLFATLAILYLIDKLMYYNRKKKTKISHVKCPVFDRMLRDFEVMNGHCVQCRTKKLCSEDIARQNKPASDEQN
jgi:hypothetical protein